MYTLHSQEVECTEREYQDTETPGGRWDDAKRAASGRVLLCMLLLPAATSAALCYLRVCALMLSLTMRTRTGGSGYATWQLLQDARRDALSAIKLEQVACDERAQSLRGPDALCSHDVVKDGVEIALVSGRGGAYVQAGQGEPLCRYAAAQSVIAAPTEHTPLDHRRGRRRSAPSRARTGASLSSNATARARRRRQ